jgi:hypothetical protein
VNMDVSWNSQSHCELEKERNLLGDISPFGWPDRDTSHLSSSQDRSDVCLSICVLQPKATRYPPDSVDQVELISLSEGEGTPWRSTTLVTGH